MKQKIDAVLFVVALAVAAVCYGSSCKPATAAKTAAVFLKIEKVTCKVLDKVCQYKDMVCGQPEAGTNSNAR